jgi:hypothetical protein
LSEFKERGPLDGAGGPGDCKAEKATPLYANAAKLAIPKRRSRRKAKRKAAKKSYAREVALYDGQNLVAVIRIGADGKCIVFDARGKRLGSYPTFRAASNALSAVGGGT